MHSLTRLQEELDLDILASEASRALTLTGTAQPTNIPTVAVIVKVPVIAIKYPLENGQVRLILSVAIPRSSSTGTALSDSIPRKRGLL
jgi:hypothetical protein